MHVRRLRWMKLIESDSRSMFERSTRARRPRPAVTALLMPPPRFEGFQMLRPYTCLWHEVESMGEFFRMMMRPA